MLIASLKQHFPARLPEWFMASVMATWGIYVILHPGIFTAPETRAMFSGMAALVEGSGFPPAGLWGSLALTVGLLRAAALFINGAYARTPVVRLISSMISAIIWTGVAIGLAKSDAANTGVAVYPWLLLLDLASAYRASVDMAVAEHNRITSGGTRRAANAGRN
ncbi:hypothetical protein [uncultured Sphingomonas sp.]|uniref:hypothetical protein n=1 Tax=uncultured Sphingomonas sp. TaxID=158754 RepID=UPI0025D15AC2|nr:hypothetical protein [uncultured Sphingomonas sp.]